MEFIFFIIQKTANFGSFQNLWLWLFIFSDDLDHVPTHRIEIVEKEKEVAIDKEIEAEKEVAIVKETEVEKETEKGDKGMYNLVFN